MWMNAFCFRRTGRGIFEPAEELHRWETDFIQQRAARRLGP